MSDPLVVDGVPTSMRIGMVRWSLGSSGGVERMMSRTSESLVQAGHHVTVATTKPCACQFAAGVRLIEGSDRGVGHRRVSPGLWMGLARARPDVVHLHGTNSAAAAFHAKGPWCTLWSPYFHKSWAESSNAERWRSVLRRTLDHIQDVVFISEAERNAFVDFVGRSPRSSVVLLPGPSWSDSDTVDREPKSGVVAVGRLVSTKRLDLVIEAAHRAGCLDVLRIVGDGPERGVLEQHVERLSGDVAAIMVGERSDAEVFALLGRSKVVMSLSDEESFGLSVWDGAMGGALLLATDLPSHREILDRVPVTRSRIVPRGDAAAAAVALRALMDLSPGADEASHQSVRSWHAYALELARFYDSVRRLGRRRTQRT